MNVAVIGSSGYIASYLIPKFHENQKIEYVMKVGETEDADFLLDLRNPEKFDYDILNSIDYIVFTAAISGPDKCAEDFELCWSINVMGTIYFISEAIKRKCKIIFFSSDAVYGDIPGKVYTEESMTRGNTPYGRMKKAVEDEFRGISEFKAIRLSYVASAQDRFVKYCLNCIMSGETAEVFHPFYRNCTVVDDVVSTVTWLIENWNIFEPQFLNVVGKELVSRVRIADELNRVFDNKLKYVVTIPNESFYKNRPQITQVESLYLAQYGILENNTFTEKIQKELKEIKDEY